MEEKLESQKRISKDELEERRFLRGRNGFFKEFIRAFRIMREYVRAFHAFRKVNNCVTIFGSARFQEDHEYYQLALNMGKLLAQNGYTVMTGGGPGIMEAANRGAKLGKGKSIGCNIFIPEEQRPNIYLDRWITCHYFFVRKVMLTKYSSAFVVLPGGFGTLDELFEMATLIQTGKIRNFPLILMGIDFWKPLLDFMANTLAANATIDIEDMNKIFITDSPKEALEHIMYIKKPPQKHPVTQL